MANCLARHAARHPSDPGREINYRLKPSLVPSAFDSRRTGPIEGSQRLWARSVHRMIAPALRLAFDDALQRMEPLRLPSW
jgi:hypothetical protein